MTTPGLWRTPAHRGPRSPPWWTAFDSASPDDSATVAWVELQDSIAVPPRTTIFPEVLLLDRNHPAQSESEGTLKPSCAVSVRRKWTTSLGCWTKFRATRSNMLQQLVVGRAMRRLFCSLPHVMAVQGQAVSTCCKSSGLCGLLRAQLHLHAFIPDLAREVSPEPTPSKVQCPCKIRWQWIGSASYSDRFSLHFHNLLNITISRSSPGSSPKMARTVTEYHCSMPSRIYCKPSLTPIM